MAGALAGRTITHELEKGRVDPTKVKRYWPGRAPDWALDEDDEVVLQQQRRAAVTAPVVVSVADRRLRRLAEAGDKEPDVEAWHRRVKPRVDSEGEEEVGIDEGVEGLKEEEEIVDEATLLDRRAEVRKRLLELRREEQDQLPQEEEDIEDEVEDESEWETDSEDERLGRRLIKPVFVPAQERETIAERMRLEQEEVLELERTKQLLEQRKIESKGIVLEKIHQEEAALKNQKEMPKSAEDVDTDDDKEEEQEFELWKKRERGRIKRERDEREAAQKVIAEREMLRGMSEEERRAWERLNQKIVRKAPKKKWRFLQKYWHKGPFFQDAPDDRMGTTTTDDLFMRDFSAPTGEDKFDKTSLPKVMQVKNFGRSGRTKWTHLVNEDTTNFDDPWSINDAQRMKYNKKMAAMDQEFEPPKKYKT